MLGISYKDCLGMSYRIGLVGLKFSLIEDNTANAEKNDCTNPGGTSGSIQCNTNPYKTKGWKE